MAVSSVQSADGHVADLAALRSTGVRVFVDGTQSIGALPLDLAGVDYLAVSGYKWLLCPRGLGFLYVRRERLDEIEPWLAGWKSQPIALRALLRAAPRSDRGRATARYVARLVPGGRSPPQPRAARRARRGADRRARPRARPAVLRRARYPAQRIGDRAGRRGRGRGPPGAVGEGRSARRRAGRRCPVLLPPLQRRGGCRPGAERAHVGLTPSEGTRAATLSARFCRDFAPESLSSG